MTNPYAKHFQDDAQPTQSNESVNPYTKHFVDTPKPAKKNYGATEVPGASLRNAPKSAVNLATGMRDMVLHPVNTASGLMDAVVGASVKMMPGTDAEMNDPRIKRAIETANAIGGAFKDRYGDYESVKRTMAEDPVGFAADLSTLLAGGAGAARATMGAGSRTARVLNTAATVTNPVAPINAATSAVARRAIPRAARYVEDVRHPTNALVTRATEGRVPEVLNALRNPRQIVPGSNPTAAQATQDVVATRFAGMGKAAEKRLPTAATNTKNAQNAARLAQIRQVGRTPADLLAAIAARDANAARNYGASGQVMVNANPELVELFNRPVMPEVFNRARTIAENEGRQFQIGHTTPASVGTSPILDHLGRPVTTTTPATFAQYSGRDMHTVKQAFDDEAFAKGQVHGIDSAEVRAVLNARDEFIRWHEAQNPAYRTARQQYALESGPIDRMRVGQYLEGKLQNPTLAEDTATLRADAFSNSLDNVLNESLGNTNIRRATGQQRAHHIRDVLTPQEMRLVESIQEDLARAKMTENQAAAASKYGDDLESAMSDAVHFSHGNKVANFFIGGANERIADRVAQAMQTPQGMAEVLQNALARDMQVSRFRGGYDQAVNAMSHNPYAYANQYPAVYNALAAQDDKKKR